MTFNATAYKHLHKIIILLITTTTKKLIFWYTNIERQIDFYDNRFLNTIQTPRLRKEKFFEPVQPVAVVPNKKKFVLRM